MSKITVYTKDFCPFCVQAKKQLTDMGFEYEEINIEADGETRRWLKVIAQCRRFITMVNCLVEGGAQELAKLSKDDINTALGNFDFDISMKL
jgi:glutaredoxin 3